MSGATISDCGSEHHVLSFARAWVGHGSSIVPPGKQESSAQDGGSLPAPFTASLVRYLL